MEWMDEGFVQCRHPPVIGGRRTGK